MMEVAAAGMSVVVLILALLGLLIAVLWILMPFAIFGTKDLLRELIREQKKTNEILIAEAKRVRARDGHHPGDEMTASR
jgi:biopolymer transport protein ExbB/TolQ